MGVGLRQSGVTLLEAVFMMVLLLVMTSMALPVIVEWRSRGRIQGAARLLLVHVRSARAQAVREGVHVGLVFTSDGLGDTTFRLHRDGNGNGVRRSEVDRGIDPPLGAPIRLGDWFAGTGFRVPISLPSIDGGPALAAGSDPVRLAGGGTVLSCSPTGSATSGTLYVASQRREVFAARILGATGRVRLLEYSVPTETWLERW